MCGQRTASLEEIVDDTQMTMAVGFCFFYCGTGSLLGPIITGINIY